MLLAPNWWFRRELQSIFNQKPKPKIKSRIIFDLFFVVARRRTVSIPGKVKFSKNSFFDALKEISICVALKRTKNFFKEFVKKERRMFQSNLNSFRRS